MTSVGFRAKELLLGVKLNWVQQGEPVTQKQNGVMSICGPERTAEFLAQRSARVELDIPTV